jgi:hypothetical protein
MSDGGALGRVERTLPDETIEALATLPGADLTTALVEVARRRAEATDPAAVLRRYEEDRFTGPGPVDPTAMAEAERELIAALPDGFEAITLSPVVPLGTHAMARVAQSRVITTERGTEVAADPTTALALEAAIRRRSLRSTDPRSDVRVDLAASQRVLRAQVFDHPDALTHFQIFGLASAGATVARSGSSAQRSRPTWRSRWRRSAAAGSRRRLPSPI